MLSLFWLFVCVLLALISPSAAQLRSLVQGDKCKEIDSQIWTCQLETNCSSLVKEMKREYCNATTDGSVVCCPPVDPDSPTTTQAQPSQPTDGLPTETALSTNPTVSAVGRKKTTQRRRRLLQARRKKKFNLICNSNQQVCYEQLYDMRNREFYTHNFCGDDPPRNDGSSFVMGGEFAYINEFPHMARVGHEIKDKVQWSCGGSLISKSFVLSAAHCAYSAKTAAKWVRLGEHDWRENTFEAAKFTYAIKDIHIPREYRSYTNNDDLALFRLNRTVSLNFNIRPVCLHADRVIPASSAIATGWGVDTMVDLGDGYHVGYAANSILQKVSLNISSDEECNGALMKYARRGKFSQGVLFNRMLCAGSSDGTKDTCQGDSGGPLQLKISSPENSYLLVGITSFGESNCSSRTPAVYMRVSEYLPWIDSIVRNDWFD